MAVVTLWLQLCPITMHIYHTTKASVQDSIVRHYSQRSMQFFTHKKRGWGGGGYYHCIKDMHGAANPSEHFSVRKSRV